VVTARWLASCLLVVLAWTACAPALRRTQGPGGAAVDLAALWVGPEDLAARDLFLGPGGPGGAPPTDAPFTVEALDRTGYSRGYDLRDASGRRWDVKVGPEAQPEVVVSRILWAIGYHQPPTYYVADWRAAGVPTAPARFRPNMDTDGEWAWAENPFVGTQPYRGLVVANVLLNNWDFKTSNNRIYEPARGEPRRYVVQDLGASLGRTRWFPYGTRNDLAGFEAQGFVTGQRDDGTVRFDYHGRHRELLRGLRVEDVVWTCRLLSRLTGQQWDDAFRAAGYDEATRRRYIAKVTGKVADGLALAGGRE
jgi:hypothetical protein